MNPNIQLLFDDLTSLTQKYHRQLPQIGGIIYDHHIEQLIIHLKASTNGMEFDDFRFPETLSEFNFDTYYEDDYDDNVRINCKIEDRFLPSIDRAYTKAKTILQSHISTYMDLDAIPQQCTHIIVPKNGRQPQRRCTRMTIFKSVQEDFNDTGKCVKHDGEYVKEPQVLILDSVII